MPRRATHSHGAPRGGRWRSWTTCGVLWTRARFVWWVVLRGCAPSHVWALVRLGFPPRQAVAHFVRSHWVLWRWVND